MELKKDFWYWFAVAVSVIAMFAWALTTAIPIGDSWIPWAAIGVILLALGSVSLRAWIRARKIAWTEELKDEQRRRAQQQSRKILLELIPSLVLSLGTLASLSLARANVLPQWVDALLFFSTLALWIWLRRWVRRISI